MPSARDVSDSDDPRTYPARECLASTICAVKKRMYSRKPTWTAETCDRVAEAVLTSAKRHRIHPALLLAVAVNESSLDEQAVAVTRTKDGREAKDSGLMGIRCVLDERGKCTNVPLRGRSWASIMDPAVNIELGARQLARWRDGGAIERVTAKIRHKNGVIEEVHKTVPCHHRTHAYWAHYNHGPIYITKGYARHYPHRVAVLYHALARSLALEAPELKRVHITMTDPGMRPRTVDRPMEPRYRELCSLIEGARGSCSNAVAKRDGASAPVAIAPIGR